MQWVFGFSHTEIQKEVNTELKWHYYRQLTNTTKHYYKPATIINLAKIFQHKWMIMQWQITISDYKLLIQIFCYSSQKSLVAKNNSLFIAEVTHCIIHYSLWNVPAGNIGCLKFILSIKFGEETFIFVNIVCLLKPKKLQTVRSLRKTCC